MKGEMFIIKPSGEIEHKPLDHTPSLEELKDGIGGGYIETVPHFTTYDGQPCIAFCDEEGKIKDMDPNLLAHGYWEKCVGRRIFNDLLVGPIVIVTGDDELLNAM